MSESLQLFASCFHRKSRPQASSESDCMTPPRPNVREGFERDTAVIEYEHSSTAVGRTESLETIAASGQSEKRLADDEKACCYEAEEEEIRRTKGLAARARRRFISASAADAQQALGT